MRFGLVGINHRTAPVAVREKAAVGAGNLAEALKLLRDYLAQGVVLATCNRIEVYTADNGEGNAEEASCDFLKAYLGITDTDLRRYAYASNDGAAVEHIFRVTCGLDSMIIGEFEVLGQVRQALKAAEQADMVNLPLRQLFQSAVRIGRRARRETGISRNALSISSVAVDLATSVVGRLENCQMLVIGAGEAGRLAVKAARDRGASRMLVASRTKERAVALAESMGAIPISLSNLVEMIGVCNIVVACADAPHRVLEESQVAAAMSNRPGLPLVIIDIAVPRNVEPAVGRIENVVLYNIDDLTRMTDLSRQQREGEVQDVERMIAAEVAKVAAWQRELELRPVIGALTEKAEEIRRAQLNRTLKKLRPLSADEMYTLDMMTRAITTRLLRDPIQYLKENGNDNRDWAEALRRLFRLDAER